MAQPSVTSRDTFLQKVLLSEQWRCLLMAGVMVLLIGVLLVRRALHGVVMSSDAVFYPSLAVFIVGLAGQGFIYVGLWRFTRIGTHPSEWRFWASAMFDVAIPIAGMTILHFNSPRGDVAALSAPVLLLIPLVVLLSVLRLKPAIPLWTGIVGAAGHAALVSHSMLMGHVEPGHAPVLYTYGFGLLLIGVAGSLVARRVRAYVVETLDEGLNAERAKAALAAVERDLAVARDIQRGLLPAAGAPLSGFDIAGMNRPADQTGGDYYDWQPLPDGRLAVVLADVTGHGIGPALVMAVCRAYSRAAAPTSLTPSVLLERINTLIHDDLRGGRFITMVIGLIGADGKVDLASAGHGPTLLYTARTGEVDWFGGDGLPLGVMPDEQYPAQRTLTLEPGDVLVMQTDGFIEWARASDNKQFGLDRMKDALRDAARGNARSIIDAIDEAVRTFSEGSPQNDDMTAVAIKRL